MNPRTFFCSTLGVCIFGLLSMGLIQYVVDPAAIFSYKQAEDIASILIRGKNATNIVNFNDRLVLKYYIEKQQAKKVDR